MAGVFDTALDYKHSSSVEREEPDVFHIILARKTMRRISAIQG